MIATKLIASTVAGVAFGAGTLALVPSQAATSPAAPAVSAASPEDRHWAFPRRKNVIHANWVTRNGVRHQAVRGVVRTVNDGFITVRAADGYTQTFRINRGTVVRVLRDGDPGRDQIGDVRVGYRALVIGVGNDLATRVIAKKPADN